MMQASCQCGETRVALTGAPFESAICYCESCRVAAQGFDRVPGAPQTVRADGGVAYGLYRKDRVRIAQGAGHLREHRLKPDSPTRRVVAACCGSPMFVEYMGGHWVTLYAARLDAALAPRICVNARDMLPGVVLPDGVPAYSRAPVSFMLRLLAAWAAMGFRRPKLVW